MSAEFRPARAEDTEMAVPLIYSSGPEAFNYVFGPSGDGGAIAYLLAAFRDGAGEFGYRNHIVGVRDGQIVAAGGGWTGATGLPFMLAAVRQFVMQFGVVKAASTIARGLATENVMPPPAKAEFYIGHLGVSEAMRGRGVGGVMLDYLLARGRESGVPTAVLDVAMTNPRAEALYFRNGFRVTKESHTKLENQFGKVPDHRRMALKF